MAGKVSKSTARPAGLLAKPLDPFPNAEYLPLASLLLPVLGASIHGSVSDWQSLLLLGLILHHILQFMRLPAGLLRASLPSRLPPDSPVSPFAASALSELRLIKTVALVVLLGSPFIAAWLLRILQDGLRPDGPPLEPFATRLCFIAAAIRPGAYLLSLLRPERPSPAQHLSTPVDELTARCRSLENTLKERTAVIATMVELNTLRAEMAGPIDNLQRAFDTAARRRESVLPTTETAEHALVQATAALVKRIDHLFLATEKRVAAAAHQQTSAQAIVRARANELLTITGTTLQRLGATLAPAFVED